MAGLLNDTAANPLTQIGMGLLAQGPSPYKINPWQGVQQGLLNAQRGQAYNQRAEQEAAQLKMLQERQQMQMAQYQQAEVDRRMASAREAAARDYLAQGKPQEALSVLDTKAAAQALLKPPDKGTSAMQEYQAAKAQGYTGSFVDYQTMMKKAGRTNVEVNTGSDFKVPIGFMRDPSDPNRVVPIPGGPQDPMSPNREFTDTQTQAGGYGARMQEAEARIKEVVGDNFNPGGGSGARDRALQAGGMATNWMRSKEGQVYEQAQHDWVRAKLRKESGAVIADEEMEREIKTYFPQPGDTDEVIAAKARSREIAVEAMKNQASGGVGGNAPQAAPATTQPESGVTDWSAL